MRLFVALDCQSLSHFFLSLQQKIDRSLIRASFPTSFHITLKFLDECSESQTKEIIDRLGKVSLDPFTIQFSKVGFFPNKERARIIWVGPESSEETISLQKDIEESLSGLFPKEERFTSHVTLARVKGIDDREKFVKNMDSLIVSPQVLVIRDFKLVSSTLTPRGPEYSDVEVFRP